MRQLSFLISLALLAGCATHKTDEPTPTPPPTVAVAVHYKLSGLRDMVCIVEVKSYSHARPDSVLSLRSTVLQGNQDVTLPLSLPKRADVKGTILFLDCSPGVRPVLPQGATVALELLAQDKVQKHFLLAATTATYSPPLESSLTLSGADY